ncbi:DUF3853 family protein [uncultured Weeksella sp.]|uniref:DUF3853 family protein n=1 Tax=uncultured Weeksella sp. TaxID=1161389 RepID=UPI00050A28EB|nr:DUF3853 family protein [uncultured Weeksella sp.]
MKNINPNKTLAELTVAEFMELQNSMNNKDNKLYAYGIKGIAKILGCSRSKAAEVKKSGILDDAIFQNRNIIVVDVEKALQLFGNKK